MAMVGLVSSAFAIVFVSRAWLVALAAAAAPVIIAVWARRRGRRVPPAAIAAQCLALAAVALALARPQAAITAGTRLPYLLLRDVSGSVRSQQSPAERVGFPRGAVVERFGFAEGLVRSGTPVEAGAGHADATRIGPALRLLASRSRQGLAAAVIVTDGRFTDSGWEGAAGDVALGGAEVLIVPQDGPPPDARIASLSAWRQAGSKVEIAVTVSSNAPLRRTLTVSRSGRDEPLLVKALSLLGEGPATVRIADTAEPDAAVQYVARLEDREEITENNMAAALVLPVRQKIAAVGLDAGPRRLLGGVTLPIALLAPAEVADDQARLAEFSAIVVADVTGSALRPGQRRALAEYVRNGGGLVMIGTGPHERPADEHDPLNQVLPLLANPFQRRPLHLAVLLDRSGSMSLTTTGPARTEQIKFDVAAAAVFALKDHLTARDALTVITFADAAKVEYDSDGGPADFAALRDALKQIRPSGSTKVLPAIQAALKLTAPAEAAGRTPMLLVLSDLQTQDEDFKAVEWAGRIRDAKGRLAVVAIGKGPPGTTPPLETLTRLLKDSASYQRRDHLAGLSEVFAGIVRRSRGEVIRRVPAAIVAEAALFETDLKALPDVEAYILAGRHPEAVPLARTGGGDPILAKRSVGLGRTVGLALPLTDRLNTAWSADPSAATLVASAVRWTLRSANDPRFDVRLDRRGDELNITVTAAQAGSALNGLRLTVEVAADGPVRKAEFRQTAPGRYEASVACPPQAPAAVAVRSDGATVWRGSAAALYPPEYRRLGADRTALERLARLTGGRVVAAERLQQSLAESYRRRLTDLWPWLLGFALLVMLAEWSLTRITRK